MPKAKRKTAGINTNNIAEGVTDNFSAALECSLCLERFQDPRELDCGHSFCFKCVLPLEKKKNNKVKHSDIICPLCRATTSLLKGVQDLRRDLTMNTFLSIEEQKQKKRKIEGKDCERVCGLCEDGESLIKYCKTCKIHLCRKCSTLHSEFSKCKFDDNVVSIKSLNEGSKCKTKMALLNIKLALSEYPNIKNNYSSIEKFKRQAKHYIQSHIDGCLTNMEAKKDRVFNQIDKYFEANKEKIMQKIDEIKDKTEILNTMKSNLEDSAEFDHPHEVITQIKTSEDQVEEYNQICTNLLNINSSYQKRLEAYFLNIDNLMDTSFFSNLEEVNICFTVNQVSKMILNHYKFSQTRMLRGLQWQMRAAPGFVEGKKHLGVWVACKNNSPSTTWSCKASIVIKLLLQQQLVGNPRYVKGFANQMFTSKAYSWGFTNYIPWNTLIDFTQGFINNDTIILETHIKAEEPVST